MKTVVIFSHPYFDASVANKTILSTLTSSNLDIEVRNIDALYPDGNIDVAAEQKALLEADTIVFQHPLFWYSVPPMFKQWIDRVFAYGFAYGAEGDKLKGKKLVHSFTTGGPADAYQPTGYNKFTLEELTLPIRATINLTQMEYVKQISSSSNTPHSGVNIPQQATQHANELIATISSL